MTTTDLTPHELGCTVAAPCSECAPTSPPPALPYWDPTFNHIAARGRAIDALTELADSMRSTAHAMLNIDQAYNIQVQFTGAASLAAARDFTLAWDQGPAEVERVAGADHHRWQFTLGRAGGGFTVVRVVCVVDAQPSR